MAGSEGASLLSPTRTEYEFESEECRSRIDDLRVVVEGREDKILWGSPLSVVSAARGFCVLILRLIREGSTGTGPEVDIRCPEGDLTPSEGKVGGRGLSTFSDTFQGCPACPPALCIPSFLPDPAFPTVSLGINSFFIPRDIGTETIGFGGEPFGPLFIVFADANRAKSGVDFMERDSFVGFIIATFSEVAAFCC